MIFISLFLFQTNKAYFSLIDGIRSNGDDEYELLWYKGIGLWLIITLIIIILSLTIAIILVFLRRRRELHKIRKNNRRFQNGGYF